MLLVAAEVQKVGKNLELHRAALPAKANQLDHFKFKHRKQRDFYDFKTQTCPKSTQKNGDAKDGSDVWTFSVFESELGSYLAQR